MIDQKKVPESIDLTKDPKYLEAMERRNARIAKAIKKCLRSTSNFMYELAQSEVTIYGLPFAEKQARFCLDGTSLSFVLQLKDEEDMRYVESKEKEYDSLRVITKHGHYLIPKAYVYSSGKIGVDVVCHVRFFQLLNFEWHKENVRRETWKAKRFERKKRERKKRERKKRDWRWKRGLEEKKYYYYRFILPITSNVMNFVRCYLQYTPTHMDNLGDLIEIPFSEEKKIHVFPLYGYLVIESQFLCTYNEMLDYTYAVSLSLGLVTTIAPFDYAFVVASEMPEFNDKIMGGMIKLRPTIRVQYKLQFSAPIEEKDFAKLVLMLHRNKNLARAAMMLLVASDDIEYLGPLYSVALETICLELFKENKDIFEECLIEKPWGKDFKNNDKKLTKPFELLKSIKYDLSEVEKLIIKTRNSFLHGDIPKGGGSADELENTDELDSVDELLYISSELRRLCMILLFRYVGIKEPKLAIFYNEKVKQTVDEKLIRKKQKEEEEEKKKKKRKSKSRQKQHAKSRQEQQAKSRQKQHANQSKNSTRKNQGKGKSPQPTEKPEAGV